MKNKVNHKRLLNLSYADLTNKTTVGKLDMPSLYCNTDVYPDFLALYNQPGLYHKTKRTGICFFEFDSHFDSANGLFHAIYYNDTK